MNSYKKRLLIISSVLLFCVVVARVVAVRYYFPSFPKLNEVASSSLEIREYESFVIPLDGKNVSALWGQVRWRVVHPGQANLLNVSHKMGVTNSQSALEALGYTFPSGTYAESGSCTQPGFRICHHPKVLDHIEQYLDFERKVSASSAGKP